MSSQLLNTPAKHAWSLSGLADTAWNTVREAAFKTGWTPACRLAESAVVALMQNMTKGQLRVLSYGHIYVFPAPGSKAERENPMPDLKAELRVVDPVFWLRLCTMSDLGFAEAYMYGDVECDDLVSVFSLFLYNRAALASMTSKASYLFSIPSKLTSYRFINSIGNSRSNISAHYDIGNDMFKGFLSEDMTYSCAIFPDLDGDLTSGSAQRSAWSGGQSLTRLTDTSFSTLNTTSSSLSSPSRNSTSHTTPNPSTPSSPKLGSDPLHDAQLRKLNHIILLLHLSPEKPYKLLEIGSGWGSLSLLLAEKYPLVEIETITLSHHQHAHVRALLASSQHSTKSNRINVRLVDYRLLPEQFPHFKGAFDRVVSVEMVEAVGREYLEAYWSVIDWALHDVRGVGVVQSITLPEARFERYQNEIDFIRKWMKVGMALFSYMPSVFPGGFLPTTTLLVETLNRGSNGKLVIDSISNIGPHYARTLREWRRRFLAHFDDIIVPSLLKDYPDVMGGPRGREEREVFKRKWLYYYCYCEVGFTTRSLGDHIITFVREGNEEYGCHVFE